MQIFGYSSHLYPWQQRYQNDGKDNSLAAIAHDCAESGLDAVETGVKQLEHAALFKACGLKISGAYIGLALHEEFDALKVEESVLPTARRLAEAGGKDLILNANSKVELAKRTQKSEDEIKRQGENMTRIARLVNPLGLKVSMHNHAASRPLAEGDLRSVIDHAGSDVGLCVDTGWAFTAGIDPLDWIRQHPERIFAFHLRNQRGDVPTEDLLEGEIDIPALMRLLIEIDYKGWLSLELWQPKKTCPQRSMIEDVQSSIRYLKDLLGK